MRYEARLKMTRCVDWSVAPAGYWENLTGIGVGSRVILEPGDFMLDMESPVDLRANPDTLKAALKLLYPYHDMELIYCNEQPNDWSELMATALGKAKIPGFMRGQMMFNVLLDAMNRCSEENLIAALERLGEDYQRSIKWEQEHGHECQSQGGYKGGFYICNLKKGHEGKHKAVNHERGQTFHEWD